MKKNAIPAAILGQHVAVLGKTGSAKTSTAKLLVEQVADDDARVVVLDPIKSDWWGITSSADGKHPGLPFQILGGPRGHVPLHAGAGAAIAELVASARLRLSILDMADFAPGGHQRFFVDFAPALMRRMRGVVYLVIEEAHIFAPKERSGLGAENMAIHWAKMLATAGRSKGIRMVVLTQRTQALHNAILGSCDTVIVHRLTAPADQEPVIKWLKANTDRETLERVAGSLSSLPTGTGWICSGEARIFERHAFPRIHTFDNTATPTGDGHELDVTTAAVDLDGLRAIVGEAVKEAEANDPAVLKAKIRTLEGTVNELERKRRQNAEATMLDQGAIGEFERRGHARGLAEGRAELVAQLGRVSNFVDEAEKAVQFAGKDLRAALDTLAALAKASPTTPSPAAPRPAEALRRPSSTPVEVQSMPRAERLILTVMAQRHPKPSTRAQLSILSGYSIKSSSFSNALSALRSRGLCTGTGDDNRPTDAGLEFLGPHFEPLPTGAPLVSWWMGRLPKAEREFLKVAVDIYPASITKEDLSAKTNYSITSSSFSNALSKLRSLELLTRGHEIKAREELFNA